MTQTTKAGSNLPQEPIALDPVYGPGDKASEKGAAAPAMSAASFTTTYQWRGNGTVLLNLRNGSIFAGSRVVASASEYNTAWNVDRFIGNATISVLNVSPYNGGVWVRLANNWGSPLNNCITLFVDP